MMNSKVEIPYTIAFVTCADKVLVLHRSKPPNQYKWNGVGGKIEQGETPVQSIEREIVEETGIRISDPAELHYGGIVTWTHVEDMDNSHRGMHVFVVEISHEQTCINKDTREGRLEWKDISWVCDRLNTDVVSNIPHFLPRILERTTPQHYACVYDNGVLVKIDTKGLN